MGKVNQWVMEMEECVMWAIEDHGIEVSEDTTVEYVREAMNGQIVDERYVRAYHQTLLNPESERYHH